MNPHSKAGVERRRDRADKAATGLDEVLQDTLATQARRIVSGYRADAPQALVAAGGDEPAPPFNWLTLWDDALWSAAFEESELFIASFVVDELEVDFGLKVTMRQPFVERLAAEAVSGIEAWSLDLKSLVGDAIDAGHREAMSVRQVAESLEELADVSANRAKAIAQTEMIASSNAASHQGTASIAEPGDEKIWRSAGDGRVRDAHKKADGQVVPFDQPFRVGREFADYPAQSTLSPGARINCRCTWSLVVA